MTILLFILSAVLTFRIVYLLATDTFKDVVSSIQQRNYSFIITIFTFIEILLYGLSLLVGDHKINAVIFMCIAHNILFGFIPSDKMLANRPLQFLFLSINFVIYCILTGKFAYNLWLGIETL